ncbi:Transcription initiation factor IIB [Candidatus Lokiarchaeum ossiferum]|uniref:Transcription initiation factor IIB n=1 Tax=Candidatus Lokiarchaeum ossiferum TaxID=2951803 RepID=A0ABY6HS76_9ARCH|nr:Transcription initiation factor IIB [Candidatus Lokiarchaeum sp. B-35]
MAGIFSTNFICQIFFRLVIEMDIERKNRCLDDVNDNCPECGSFNLLSDQCRGDLICSSCGLILESNAIDQGAEWRAFNSADMNKKSRVGAPSSLSIHDKGLSTIIDWRDRDAFGNKLSPKRRAQAYRLRKWQVRMRIHSSIDRNLAFAMSELDRLCSQIGIAKIHKETAALIYRRTIDMKLIRGRSIEAMIAGSIYAACRIARIPRTLDEFAKNSRINRRELGRCYRLILRELKLKIPTATPTRFISRFANDLKVSTQSQLSAIKILKEASRRGITSGKDPCGLAAASIYVAAFQHGERKTQKEIARVANITEVTVRNRYKELIKHLNITMNPLE